MRKYDSIVKRVEQYEYKMGVSYLKTKGKLFFWLRIINLLAVIYLFLINSITIISFLFRKANSAKGITNVTSQTMVLIIVSTLIEVVSVILLFNKPKIVGSALGIIPIPYLIFIFIKLCEGYESGFFGINMFFYYRHLPSFLLITVCCVIMFIIAVNERVRTTRTYNRLFANIYKNYSDTQKNKGVEVSEEEWNDFITNYDPREFKV